jgi:peroxiredoxin
MKAKQIIGLIGIMVFFISSVVVLHKVSSTLQVKKEQYAILPDFHLQDLNGEMVSNTLIDRNKATLFYFFDPDCNLCHSTFDGLKKRQKDFSEHQILLITLISEEKVKEFLEEIDFIPPENIKILLDENAELIALMDVKSPPTSLIYKEAKLIKRFDGPVTIEALIKYLQ